MRKKGPCYHCAISITPLWRNGPPEKPVLCNACGSRWRTKGTLENYTPLHAQYKADDPKDSKASSEKPVSVSLDDDDAASAISKSESCGEFGYESGSDLDLPDDLQSLLWDSKIPSRKRSRLQPPELSMVEKLTRDLYGVLQDQQKCSQLSLYDQDGLIYENDKSMKHAETRYGSMLIQCPSSTTGGGSETSSVSFDNKQISETVCPDLETKKTKR